MLFVFFGRGCSVATLFVRCHGFARGVSDATSDLTKNLVLIAKNGPIARVSLADAILKDPMPYFWPVNHWAAKSSIWYSLSGPQEVAKLCPKFRIGLAEKIQL